MLSGTGRMQYFFYRRSHLALVAYALVVAASLTALISYMLIASPANTRSHDFKKINIPGGLPVFQLQDDLQVSTKNLKCKIPTFEPWDPSLKDIVSSLPSDKDTYQCTWNQSQIVYLSFEGYLTIATNEETVNCSYRCIYRGQNSDFDLEYSNWIQIDPISGTKSDCEHMEVECSQSEKPPYRKFFAQIVPTEKKEPKMEKPPVDKLYNIIMIVMDSSSQLNYYRMMPRTLKVLNETFGAQIFTGFTKTGDSSFSNGESFLSGRPYEKLSHEEIFEQFLDDPKWNWTWNWFSDLGYKTFYAEDAACCDLFSYMKKGFIKKPFDHMYRPLMVACDLDPECIKLGLCYAGEKKHVRELNFLHQFLNKYDASVPKFALFWNTELAHNDLQKLAYADIDLANFLLDNQEQLKESFLVVMGDHGQRHTAIRQTVIGHFEDRMPFFSLSVPHALKQRYPAFTKNLKANSKTLACFYDHHVTLQDIYLGQLYGWQNLHKPLGSNVNRPFPGSDSLLRPLSTDRSCFDIGVQEHYCSCIKSVEIDTESSLSQSLASHLLEYLNRMLEKRTECAKLSLKNIKRSEQLTLDYKLQEYHIVLKVMYMKTGESRAETLRKYRLTIEVAPSDGVFEGTLSFDGNNFAVVPPVERINTYGNQSSCITDDYLLRSYCYCTTFNQTQALKYQL